MIRAINKFHPDLMTTPLRSHHLKLIIFLAILSACVLGETLAECQAHTLVSDPLPEQTYLLIVGKVVQSWSFKKFNFQDPVQQTACEQYLTYSANGYSIVQATLTLKPNYSVWDPLNTSRAETLTASWSDSTVALSQNFVVKVALYCTNPQVSILSPQTCNLVSTTIPVTWNFPKFNFQGATDQANCWDQMTYSVENSSRYTVTEGAVAGTITLQPTFTTLDCFGHYTETLIAYDLNGNRVASTTFTVTVVDAPLADQTYNLIIGALNPTAIFTFPKWGGSDCFNKITYTTIPSSYIVNQISNNADVLLQPTYFDASWITGSPLLHTLVATLVSDPTVTRSQTFSVTVVDYCVTYPVSFASIARMGLTVNLDNNSNIFTFQLQLGTSSDMINCGFSRMKYYRLDSAGNDSSWITINQDTALLTLAVPAGQLYRAFSSSTLHSYTVENSIPATTALLEFYFVWTSPFCTAADVIVTQISATNVIYYPHLGQGTSYFEQTHQFSTLFTATSSNTACQQMYISYSWCGRAAGSNHVLNGQIVINIAGCPDAATYTSPRTYFLTFYVINPSQVSKSIEYSVIMTQPCPTATFEWSTQATIPTLQQGLVYTNAFQNDFKVHGGNVCGTMSFSYSFAIATLSSDIPTIFVANNYGMSIGSQTYTSSSCAPTCVTTTPQITEDGIGSHQITAAITDTAANYKYIFVKFCVTQDQTNSELGLVTVCNPKYFIVKVEGACKGVAPTCPSTSLPWPFGWAATTDFYIYEIKDYNTAPIKSFIIPSCNNDQATGDTCSIKSQYLYDDTGCSNVATLQAQGIVSYPTIPATWDSTNQLLRTLKISTNSNAYSADYTFCYQAVNNAGTVVVTAPVIRVRIVQDCSNVNSLIVVTPPVDVHLVYTITTPPTIQTFILSPFTVDTLLCPVYQLSQSYIGDQLPANSWVIKNNTLATTQILEVTLSNFDGANQVGTVPVSLLQTSEYVITRTQSTKDGFSKTQTIYLNVLPDCSQMILTWPTAQTDIEYTVYSGFKVQPFQMFQRDIKICTVSSLKIQMDFGAGFVDTSLLNNPYTLTSIIANKFDLQYSGITPSISIHLTTEAQNELAFDSVTPANFKIYPAQVVVTPTTTSAGIATTSFSIKLIQTCNKATTDTDGPAIIITPPAAAALVQIVKVNTPSTFNIPNFTTNEPTCLMTYSLTLASQPAGGNAPAMFSLTSLNNGSGNSFLVLFNGYTAININWGLYTFNYCAKNFQTSDYCTLVSVTVLPDCSVESVIYYSPAFFAPFEVSYIVNQPQVSLNMYPAINNAIESVPSYCSIYSIKLAVTKTDDSTGVLLPDGTGSASYLLFQYTTYVYTDSTSGQLLLQTNDNTHAFGLTAGKYIINASVNLHHLNGVIDDIVPTFFTMSSLFSIYVHKDCRSSQGIAYTNSAEPTLTYATQYFVEDPVQLSQWSQQPTFTLGCESLSYELRDSTDATKVTNTDGTQITASSIYSIDTVTGQFSFSTTTDSLAGDSFTQHPALLNALSYNGTIYQKAISVKVWSRCYRFHAVATTQSYTYTLSEVDDITDPLKPILVAKKFPMPLLSFSYYGLPAVPNLALCGVPRYTLTPKQVYSKTGFYSVSAYDAAINTANMLIETQDPSVVSSYEFWMGVNFGPDNQNSVLYQTDNPLGFTFAPVLIALEVVDICIPEFLPPPELFSNSNLWTSTVRGPPQNVMISPVIISLANQNSSTRYCGVFQNSFIYSPGFLSVTNPMGNNPNQQFPVYFTIDAQSTTMVGDYKINVIGQFSKKTLLSPMYNYTFNVTIRLCKLTLLSYVQTPIAPVNKFTIYVSQMILIDFNTIVQVPKCDYPVVYSLKEWAPSVTEINSYQWAKVNTKSDTTKTLQIFTENTFYSNKNFTVQLRADIQNYPYNETEADKLFITTILNDKFQVQIFGPTTPRVNTPPYYTSFTPLVNLEIGKKFDYEMPQLMDKEGDPCFVSKVVITTSSNAEINPTWITYDLNYQPPKFSFSPSELNQGETYKMQLTVLDQNPTDPKSQVYAIAITVKQLPVVVRIFNDKSNDLIDKTVTLPPTVVMSKPSNRGNFNLTFSQIMSYPYNSTYIATLNSTNEGNRLFPMQIYKNATQLLDESLSEANSIFTWKITKIDSQCINFQMQFKNGYDISKTNLDTLHLNLTKSDQYISIINKQLLQLNGTLNGTFLVRIPKQLSVNSTDMTPSFKTLSDSMTSFLASNMLMSFLFAGSLQFFLFK